MPYPVWCKARDRCRTLTAFQMTRQAPPTLLQQLIRSFSNVQHHSKCNITIASSLAPTHPSCSHQQPSGKFYAAEAHNGAPPPPTVPITPSQLRRLSRGTTSPPPTSSARWRRQPFKFLVNMPPAGNEYAAEQLKQQGNTCFKNGDYEGAEGYYSQAIQKNPSNPLFFTNRAQARNKLEKWEGVMDDCIRSIEQLPENMKAFHLLCTFNTLSYARV